MRRLTDLTPHQFKELCLYADGEPRRGASRPNKNLIRRNLLTLAPASGRGYYRITEYGLAALAERPLAALAERPVRPVSFTTGNPVTVTVDVATGKVLEVVVDLGELLDRGMTFYAPDPDDPTVWRELPDDHPDAEAAAELVAGLRPGDLPAPTAI